MNRGPLTLAIVLGLSLSARAEPPAPGLFDASWAGLPFGANRDALVGFLKDRIRKRYESQIRGTREVAAQDRLKRAMEAEVAQVGSDYVAFTGQQTGWDVSVVRGEFAHGTGEAMLHLQEGRDHYYFFFSKDIFYKLIRTGVDRPMTAYVEEMTRVYGTPTRVEHQDPKAQTGIRLAAWEDDLLVVSVEDRTRLYQCVLMRWVLRAADEAVRAEWDRLRGTGPGINPLIQEAVEPTYGDDAKNPVDEILGRPATREEPPAAPASKPKRKKAPQKR